MAEDDAVRVTERQRMKLTDTQIELLREAEPRGVVFPGPSRASSAMSLVRRGLLHDEYFGRYEITDAGRRALTEGPTNA